MKRIDNWKYVGYAGITVYSMQRTVGAQALRLSLAVPHKDLEQARGDVARRLRTARRELREMVREAGR